MSPFEVNNALWDLVNGQNLEEAAAAVIAFGHKLKSTAPVAIDWNYQSSGQDAITGQTDRGLVTTGVDGKETKEIVVGFHKARIGHFKVWKSGRDEIWFHHFWKSDQETAGGEVEVMRYRIRYNPQTLKLLHFGPQVSVQIFSLWIVALTANFINPAWGKKREFTSVALIFG